jgi:glucuronosyltransferase
MEGKFIYSLNILARGHHVTAITTFEYEHKSENLTEILIKPMFLSPNEQDNFRFASNCSVTGRYSAAAIEAMYSGSIGGLYVHKLALDFSEWGLKDPKVQQFINRDDLYFDLILMELIFQESWLMFAHKFKAPIVGMSKYLLNMKSLYVYSDQMNF